MVTVSKMAIKPLIMTNGKMPPQFPATRGEFEHLTSKLGLNKVRVCCKLIAFTEERYEALMKSYDIPISGDTAAKRDALRSFVGIPQ